MGDFWSQFLALLGANGVVVAAGAWYLQTHISASLEKNLKSHELLESEKTRREAQRWDEKRAVCEKALAIADSVLSYSEVTKSGKRAVILRNPRFPIEEARNVLNGLITTCEDPELVESFMLLMSGGPKDLNALGRFRQCVRRELGYSALDQLKGQNVYITCLEAAQEYDRSLMDAYLAGGVHYQEREAPPKRYGDVDPMERGKGH